MFLKKYRIVFIYVSFWAFYRISGWGVWGEQISFHAYKLHFLGIIAVGKHSIIRSSFSSKYDY